MVQRIYTEDSIFFIGSWITESVLRYVEGVSGVVSLPGVVFFSLIISEGVTASNQMAVFTWLLFGLYFVSFVFAINGIRHFGSKRRLSIDRLGLFFGVCYIGGWFGIASGWYFSGQIIPVEGDLYLFVLFGVFVCSAAVSVLSILFIFRAFVEGVRGVYQYQSYV